MYAKESLTYWISENKSAREMYYSMKSNLKKPHKTNQPKTQAPHLSKTIKPRYFLLVKDCPAERNKLSHDVPALTQFTCF